MKEAPIVLKSVAALAHRFLFRKIDNRWRHKGDPNARQIHLNLIRATSSIKRTKLCKNVKNSIFKLIKLGRFVLFAHKGIGTTVKVLSYIIWYKFAKIRNSISRNIGS